MLTVAKLAIAAVIVGGILSLFCGFSFNSGVRVPNPRPNVVHTTVKMYNPPVAHWPKGHAHYNKIEKW